MSYEFDNQCFRVDRNGLYQRVNVVSTQPFFNLRWLMKNIFFLLFCLPFSLSTFAQNPEKARIYYQQANIAFSERKMDKGIELMEKAIDKDPNYAEAYFRLGSLYNDLLADPDKAMPYYEKALQIKPDYQPFAGAYFTVGMYELHEGHYDKAKPYFEQFLTFKPLKDSQIREAKRMIATCDFARETMKNPLTFKPSPLKNTVNKFQLQYFPALTADRQTLVFTARQSNRLDSDENLMISTQKNGEWQAPVSISPEINTAFNEGTGSISADGRTLVFTCCQGREGYGSCDLFVSYKKGENWSDPVNMGPKINTMAWESQPSLSADGRQLFFASDRRGGLGKRDVWVSLLDDEGYWQTPVNLGINVNTPYDDLSPFIHVNGKTLYFSSAGQTGLGGFDLFSTEKIRGSWTKAENLGYPINDHLDQVSLFVTSDGKKGYYTHEQRENRQLMRSLLYEFDIPESIRVKYSSDFLKGLVYDAKTSQKLEARIELYDVAADSLVAVMSSDPKSGNYLTVLTEGSEYALYINKAGYLFKSLYFNFLEKKDREPLVIDIPLIPIETGAKESLRNLFFATNEYKLEGKSKVEINKIVRFMNEYPGIILEISGHTDDVDTEVYNKELSLKRAKEIYDYLLRAGINDLRLKFAGYGESQPCVPNTSDANRALNRRIEFKVLKK
jgi:OmpA-OmpF porin, OOP family